MLFEASRRTDRRRAARGGKPRAARRAALAALVACAWGQAAEAQVVLDGSLGHAGALSGPNFAITPDLGRLAKNNLFYSFSRFDVPTGATATFSGPSTVTNIVSRVTGGTLSTIDGTLSSTIQGANLYLLNPAGILFGPNARLNVPAGFHASTSDYLGFIDGARFSASLDAASSFTSAAPAAFGFLSSAPRGITLSGSNLAAPTGRTLSLVGGDIAIGGGAKVSAPGGFIQLASTAGPGAVPVDPTIAGGYTVAKGGSVTISGGAVVDVSDPSAANGAIFVRGGAVTVDASELGADNHAQDANKANAIAIDARSIMIANFSKVHADSYAAGAAGAIAFTADTVTIRDPNTTVWSIARSSGKGGDVNITATGAVNLFYGGTILNFSLGSGNAGSASIDAGEISVSKIVPGSGVGYSFNPIDFSLSAIPNLFYNSAISNISLGTGEAGDVSLRSRGPITIADGALVQSAAESSGKGGSVSIYTPDSIFVATGAGVGSTTGVTVLTQTIPAVTGKAGSVSLTAGKTISVTGGASINSDSFHNKFGATGAAGDISIIANNVIVSGSGPSGPSYYFDSNNNLIIPVLTSSIETNAYGNGNGGNISIATTAGLLVSAGGRVSATSSESGTAGSVTIGGVTDINGGVEHVGPVVVSGAGSTISTQGGAVLPVWEAAAFGPSEAATGNAGKVSVDGATVSVMDGGAISSGNLGSGAGGGVSVSARDSVRVSGVGAGGLASSISASTTGAGQAGNVKVTAPRIDIVSGGQVATSAAAADGGNIELKAADLVHLNRGAVTTSVQGGFGNGGNITIDPRFVVLSNSEIKANAVRGHGGDITITAGSLLRDPNSSIEASSALGISGNIVIAAPVATVGSAIGSLTAQRAAAVTLAERSCGVRAGGGQASSLSPAGKGGQALQPSAPLTAGYPAAGPPTLQTAQAVLPLAVLSNDSGKPGCPP
jgi:filamentous hemagglutinin family protein